MRIAIVVPSTTDDSGTNLQALAQATFLKKAGHEVRLFAYHKQDELLGMPVESLKSSSSQLIRDKLFPGLISRLPPPLHIPLISRYLSPFQDFKVIIAYGYPLGWLGYYAKKFYRLRLIWFMDGVMLPPPFRVLHRKVYFWLLKHWLWKQLGNAADLVIVETEYLQEVFKHVYGIKSMVTLSLINLDSFNSHLSGEEVRSLYHLGDRPLILYIDRLEPEKNIEILLYSFKLIRKAIPSARLMLIGRCPSRSYWRKIQQLSDDTTIFIDYIPHDHLPSFYAAATVFVTSATQEEGYSHTIVEAQACGRPVVAFNVGAHKEVVRNGETGILVDSVGDAQKFASAVIKLLSNQGLISEMGHKATKWASYLAEEGTNRMNELLSKIMNVQER